MIKPFGAVKGFGVGNNSALSLDSGFEVVKKLNEVIEHINKAEEPEKETEWISIKDRLPESGEIVLLLCETRNIGGAVFGHYVCDGYYAKRYTENVYHCGDDIACEYNEEDDEYYLLEGWYEVIKNWEEYSSIVIDDFVTHWQPLPEPPKGE